MILFNKSNTLTNFDYPDAKIRNPYTEYNSDYDRNIFCYEKISDKTEIYCRNFIERSFSAEEFNLNYDDIESTPYVSFSTYSIYSYIVYSNTKNN